MSTTKCENPKMKRKEKKGSPNGLLFLFSMDERDLRIVCFALYCGSCAHFEKKENEEPCDDCLDHPMNEHTDKPVNWTKKEAT